MTQKEQEIQNYMEKLQISRKEAEELWQDDHDDFIGEEGEQYETKAKQAGRRYEQSEKKKRKPSKRERKVDTEKWKLLNYLMNGIKAEGIEIAGIHNETDFTFDFGEFNFTVKLTRHKKKVEVQNG